MKNLKVSQKLALGFGTILVLSVILSAIAVFSSLSIDDDYTYLLEYPQQRYDTLLKANNRIKEVKNAVSNMSMFAGLGGKKKNINNQLEIVNRKIEEFNTEIDDYIFLVQSDKKYSIEEKDERIVAANDIKTLAEKWYNEIILPIVKANLEGNRQEVINLSIPLAATASELFDSVDDLVVKTQDIVESVSDSTTSTSKRSLIILIIISFVIILISICFAVVISAGIVKPLSHLTIFMKKASDIGNITLLEEDVKIIDIHSHDKDEIGMCISSSGLFIKRIIKLQRILERQKKRLEKHNINLKGEVDKKTKTVFELQITILKTVADLIESRDYVTGGHIERTQHYLRLLVNLLIEHGVYADEISSWDIDLFVMSSQLHDVGKISINDNILMKPDKLTDDEFEEIKKHAAYGVDIIGKISKKTDENAFLQYAEVLTGSHHEKWNGKGYPHGLKGDEIPLPGRLMAIIDVYDALTNERPYKKKFSHEEAIEIIKNGLGTDFDPLISEVFLRHEKDFKDIIADN